MLTRRGREYRSLRLTKLRESHKLAAVLASLIYPMNRLLDRKLKVKPARFGVDGCCLVLLGNVRGHCWDLEESLIGDSSW